MHCILTNPLFDQKSIRIFRIDRNFYKFDIILKAGFFNDLGMKKIKFKAKPRRGYAA